MKITQYIPRRGVLVALCVVFLTACDHRPAVSEFRDLPAEGWFSRDTVTFRADTLAAAGDYLFTLTLRSPVSRPYPYRELVLERRLRVDSCERIDTLTLCLTGPTGDDDSDGVAIQRYTFAIDTLRLAPPTGFVVSFRHIMRRDPIDNFCDIGLTVSRP